MDRVINDNLMIEEQIRRHMVMFYSRKNGYVFVEFKRECQKYVLKGQTERKDAIFLHVMQHESQGRLCKMTRKLLQKKSWHVLQRDLGLRTFLCQE